MRRRLGELTMIELRHLRYFIAVAEELTFRRAAERVHVDQTPVSRTIRDLEEQLGVQLFVRAPRKLRLTPAGARLLEDARKVFIRIERAKRAVRETDARLRAPLRVGVADGIAQRKLSECLVRWREVAPNIPLDLAEVHAGELASALHREEIDAGFSFGRPDHDAIAQEPAWSYPLMALLPLRHELASCDRLALSDLLAFPLLKYCAEHQPGLRQQMDRIVGCRAQEATLAGEACTFAGYVTRIAAGMGVGLVDSGHTEILRSRDMVAVPLEGDACITTYVLHKHQRCSLPDALQRFLAHIKTSQ